MDEEKQNEHLLQASLQWRLEDELVAQFHAMQEQKADDRDGGDGRFSIGECTRFIALLMYLFSLLLFPLSQMISKTTYTSHQCCKTIFAVSSRTRRIF